MNMDAAVVAEGLQEKWTTPHFQEYFDPRSILPTLPV
jgi:hypothetical protein